MDKFKKYAYIISGVSLLNILLLIITSIGFLEYNPIAKIYFFLSFTLIPLLTMVLLIVSQYYAIEKENIDLNVHKNKWYMCSPFISLILIILIFTVKFAIQLDKMVLTEVISLGIAYILAQLMMTLIYRNKDYSYRRSIRIYLTSFLLYALFVALIMILVFDYSTNI